MLRPLAIPLLVLAACKADPLYCDEKTRCTDPDRPFCDFNGEYPASEGIARTCIPDPNPGSGAGADGGPEPDGGSGGVPEDAQPQADAAPGCRWTPLGRLSQFSTGDMEGGGSLDFDGLNLYFYRGGAGAIFHASRDSIEDGFGKASLVEELQGYDPKLSSSGLEMFTSNGQEISVAERTSITGTFGPASSTGLNGASPSVSHDGLAMYFISYKGDSVERATRATAGSSWEYPSPVLVLAGGGYAVDVSGDELRLLLVPNPPDPRPIMIAERASVDDLFGPPMPLNEELYTDDPEAYRSARWDASQTHLVVAIAGDLYYSECR